MSQDLGPIQLINRVFQKYFKEYVKDNPLTFIVGKAAFAATESPTSDAAKQNLAGAIIGKTVNAEDSFYLVVSNNLWTRGASYNAYRPDRINKNHYVLVTAQNGKKTVYLCIENGDSYEASLLSVEEPNGRIGQIIKMGDGYKWMALYHITGHMTKFLTSNYIPVPTQYDIDQAPSSSSLKLTNAAMDYWKGNSGKLLRFDIANWMRDIRWSSKPIIQLRQRTGDDANIDVIFEYDADNVVVERRGWSLLGINVKSDGSGYTRMIDAMHLDSEPDDNKWKVTSDHIIGNDYNSLLDTHGPAIVPVFTLGALDLPTILRADKSMLVVTLDASDIAQLTDATSFDSVSLVQNLKHSNGQNIDKVIGKNTAFRASTKINYTDLSGFSPVVGNEIQGIDIIGSKRSIGSKVISHNATKKFIEISNYDGYLSDSAMFFDSSATKPTTIITNVADETSQGKATLSGPDGSGATGSYAVIVKASYVGDATPGATSAASGAIDRGEGRRGDDTIVLYTNKLGHEGTLNETQTIRARFVMGGDKVEQI